MFLTIIYTFLEAKQDFWLAAKIKLLRIDTGKGEGNSEVAL